MTQEEFTSLQVGDTVYICAHEDNSDEETPAPPKEVTVKELLPLCANAFGENLDAEYAEACPFLAYWFDRHNGFKTLEEAQAYYTWQCNAYCRELLAQAVEFAMSSETKEHIHRAILYTWEEGPQ